MHYRWENPYYLHRKISEAYLLLTWIGIDNINILSMRWLDEILNGKTANAMNGNFEVFKTLLGIKL